MANKHDRYERLKLIIEVALESVASGDVTAEEALQFIKSQL